MKEPFLFQTPKCLFFIDTLKDDTPRFHFLSFVNVTTRKDLNTGPH